MTDTAQPAPAAETEVVDPIAAAADAFKTYDPWALDKPEKPRGPDGKFVSTAEPVEAAEEEIEAEEQGEQPEAEAESQEVEQETEEAAEEAQPDAVDLPTSWPAEQAETWKSLPPETQAFIVEREGQRDAAVNAKFQEAANLRKANEAEINEAKANRQAFKEAAEFVLSLPLPPAPSMTMLDQRSSDYNPDAYHLQKAQYDQRISELQAVYQQHQQVAQLDSESSAKEREARVAQINEQHGPDLIKLVPDLADQSKADAAFHGLARYALSQGVPEDTELSAFTAVELKLLAKAQKYDEMMAAKAKVQPKAPKPAAPVVKPGVATPKAAVEQQRRKQAFARLDSEGSIEAGAAAFAALSRK